MRSRTKAGPDSGRAELFVVARQHLDTGLAGREGTRMTRRETSRVVRPPGIAKPAMGASADGVDPILVAAACLFEERGYDETTIAAIAERAGVCRQHVHQEYGSKPGAKARILAGIVIEFSRTFAIHALAWEGADSGDSEAGSRPGQAVPRDTGLDRLTSGLQDYTRLRGPLARVALAARDLPWLADLPRSARRVLEHVVRFHLPAAASSPAMAAFVIESLRRLASSGGARPASADQTPSTDMKKAVAAVLASGGLAADSTPERQAESTARRSADRRALPNRPATRCRRK